jgi:hypothetical protein
MAVNDAQEAIQERRIREQSENVDKDEDLVLTNWLLRRATKRALLKCSKYSKVGHTIKFCSL